MNRTRSSRAVSSLEEGEVVSTDSEVANDTAAPKDTVAATDAAGFSKPRRLRTRKRLHKKKHNRGSKILQKCPLAADKRNPVMILNDYCFQTTAYMSKAVPPIYQFSEGELGHICEVRVPRAGVGGKASGETKKLAKYYAAEAALKGLIEDTGKSRAELGRQRRQSYRSAEKQRKADQARGIKPSSFELTPDNLPEGYPPLDSPDSRKALVILLKGLGKRWNELVVTKYTTATGIHYCHLEYNPKVDQDALGHQGEGRGSTEAEAMNVATKHLFTRMHGHLGLLRRFCEGTLNQRGIYLPLLQYLDKNREAYKPLPFVRTG